MKFHVLLSLASIIVFSLMGLNSNDSKFSFVAGTTVGVGIGTIACTLIEDSIKKKYP